MNDSQERLLSALIHLADGCLQYTNDYWKVEPITKLPDTFQQGWNILVDIGLQLGIPYPQSLQDLNSYLHTPIESWHGHSSSVDELGIQGSLLWNGLPRDLCYDLRADSNSRYLQDEIDQRKFREVYVYCKQNNLDTIYRSIRGFIAQNPYLLHGQMEINSMAMEDDWHDDIRN